MVTPTIAKTTFREVLFSPLYIVISLVGITAVILLGLIPYFTLILSDEDGLCEHFSYELFFLLTGI